VGLPLLLVIIQQKPLQVNHQYDVQSRKAKAEGILDLPLRFWTNSQEFAGL